MFLVKRSEKSNGALFKHSPSLSEGAVGGVALKRVRVQSGWLHVYTDLGTF